MDMIGRTWHVFRLAFEGSNAVRNGHFITKIDSLARRSYVIRLCRGEVLIGGHGKGRQIHSQKNLVGYAFVVYFVHSIVDAVCAPDVREGRGGVATAFCCNLKAG